MSDRLKTLYLLNVTLALAFLISGLSGLVLWLAPHEGYLGGRNPNYNAPIFLGLTRAGWDDLHLWGSLVMGAAVLVHLVLHWNWIVCVTKRFLAPPRRQPKPVLAEAEACRVEVGR